MKPEMKPEELGHALDRAEYHTCDDHGAEAGFFIPLSEPEYRALLSALRALTTITPIRQHSAHGEPSPTTRFERRCADCGASFLKLAFGKTGERGIWSNDGKWHCSKECFTR